MTETEHSGARVDYLRQLALASLESYRGGFADLERVDRDLKSITRSLEEVADRPWADSVSRQWFQLEIIYASLLHEKRSALTQDEEAEVQDVIAGLKAILQSYELPSALDRSE